MGRRVGHRVRRVSGGRGEGVAVGGEARNGLEDLRLCEAKAGRPEAAWVIAPPALAFYVIVHITPKLDHALARRMERSGPILAPYPNAAAGTTRTLAWCAASWGTRLGRRGHWWVLLIGADVNSFRLVSRLKRRATACNEPTEIPNTCCVSSQAQPRGPSSGIRHVRSWLHIELHLNVSRNNASGRALRAQGLFGLGDGPHLLSEVACSGSEAELLACGWEGLPDGCWGYAAGAACYGEGTHGSTLGVYGAADAVFVAGASALS